MNDIFNDNVSLKTETPAIAKHMLPAVPSQVFNEDCVEALKRFSDNHFDLAIVDPPYGIGFDGEKPTMVKKYSKGYTQKSWDKNAPDQEYFDQLLRVSKNQIVWGANHFISKLPYDSPCWLFWDKQKGDFSLADGELAWTSFKTAVRQFTYRWHGFIQQKMGDHKEERIHPTQKPVDLYSWLLKNYAKEGDLILDTHVGSGSSRIACNKAGLPFIGFEIDKEYYDNQEKRFNAFISQLRMF